MTRKRSYGNILSGGSVDGRAREEDSVYSGARPLLPSIAGSVVVAACGGGGAPASGGPGGPALPLADAVRPPVYEFSLSDTGGVTDRLVARTDFGSGTDIDVVIDSRIEPTLGRYDRAGRTVTFTAGAVTVESDFGFIVVDILGPIVLAPGEAPHDVTLELTISFEGLVRLSFGDGTVDIRRAQGPATTLSIDEFEGQLRNRVTGPVVLHQSALGWAALDLLRHLIVATGDLIDVIDPHLESVTSIDTICELFPGTPPPGIVNAGLVRRTWLGAGSIGSGDDFSAEYTGCWQDGAGGRGVLLDGRLDFRGLVGTVSNGVLTTVGFQTVTGLGGVLPDDLAVVATRTVTPAGAELLPELGFTLSHGVRLEFDSP